MLGHAIHPEHATLSNVARLVLLQYKKVAPVGDRVFVKVDDSEATTAGGILLPTSAQKKQTQGSVVDNGDATSLKV